MYHNVKIKIGHKRVEGTYFLSIFQRSRVLLLCSFRSTTVGPEYKVLWLKVDGLGEKLDGLVIVPGLESLVSFVFQCTCHELGSLWVVKGDVKGQNRLEDTECAMDG